MPVTTPADLTPADRDAVLALAAAVAEADAVEAISEQPLLDVRRPTGRPVRHALVRDGGELVAYAQADLGSGVPTSAELAVHPGHRRRGHGTAALADLRDAVAAELDGGGTLSVWAHGDLPPARAFAAARGLARTRDLYVMGLDLAGGTVAQPDPTPGTRVDPFRPGVDEEAWVTLNAAAFADHPEQGRMTAADLLAREEEPWFDPDRLWFVRPAEDPDAPPLASMWVKAPPGEPAVEIYALAVHPGAQGRGLGGQLTDHALADARARGDARMELYVDGDNAAAVRVYERAGFVVDETHAQYTG